MTTFLPDALRRSAERFGDKPAFRHDGQDLTYAQLTERANQLGNALLADGVGRGDRVGILAGKGLDNAVAVYGIQAAGGAYVPIDPSAPRQRQARIMADCGIRHLVTDDARAARAAALASTVGDGRVMLYGIDEVPGRDGADRADPSVSAVGWDEVATGPATTPPVELSADDIAYLIFTSGSTGVPKGIVHTHASAAAYAAMAAELYGLTEADRLSNFPPLHFDQSTFDFFSGPRVGATTVIIGNQHQMVPASLSQLIEDERLTIWYSVPLALVQLLLYGVLDQRDHTSLRWVVYGGEPFPLKHLKALMERWPQARFSNCYGPAETNQCTYHHLAPLTDDDVERAAGVPIGVACPDTDLRIVGPDDQPVATGDPGELLVSAPTMMRGYWGRPDLDTGAFVEADGSAGGPARRYYRTGDLVRLDAADRLEFLGRSDRQVKTRGFRVELDEVEAVLSSGDGIEEVAVTTAPGDDDSLVLVAHVSLRPGAEPDQGALRRHAATRLPRYAIPADIRFVEHFPRTTSGKIDYRALEHPAAADTTKVPS